MTSSPALESFFVSDSDSNSNNLNLNLKTVAFAKHFLEVICSSHKKPFHLDAFSLDCVFAGSSFAGIFLVSGHIFLDLGNCVHGSPEALFSPQLAGRVLCFFHFDMDCK